MASSRSALKDVLLAVAIVGGVLGGLFLYTGVWPPMVVVESGSMMHGVTCPPPVDQPDLCDNKVGYGKFGTIDPGDMVFVKKSTKREDLTAMADAAAKDPGERNYGKPGDVVVYFPNNLRQRTPIIHRAIAFVQVNGVVNENACAAGSGPGPGVSYRVFWEGRNHDFGPSGIFLPSMGFGPSTYREDNGWKPCWSGFVTKGDNPVSNTLPDQALGGPTLPNQPVRIEWIEGKAVGELPWFGLIKLALSPDVNYFCALPGGTAAFRAHEPACDDGRAVRVLNANAPADLWVMLGVSLAVIGIAPIGYDMYVLKRNKEREAMRARGEDPGPTLTEKLLQRLQRFRKPNAAPAGGEAGSTDPDRAFEPPPPGPSTPPPTTRAPPAPPSKPPEKGPTKFERVTKK